jgi:hypothetical protein
VRFRRGKSGARSGQSCGQSCASPPRATQTIPRTGAPDDMANSGTELLALLRRLGAQRPRAEPRGGGQLPLRVLNMLPLCGAWVSLGVLLGDESAVLRVAVPDVGTWLRLGHRGPPSFQQRPVASPAGRPVRFQSSPGLSRRKKEVGRKAAGPTGQHQRGVGQRPIRAPQEASTFPSCPMKVSYPGSGSGRLCVGSSTNLPRRGRIGRRLSVPTASQPRGSRPRPVAAPRCDMPSASVAARLDQVEGGSALLGA